MQKRASLTGWLVVVRIALLFLMGVQTVAHGGLEQSASDEVDGASTGIVDCRVGPPMDNQWIGTPDELNQRLLVGIWVCR